jgi:hypothetical protein
MKKSHGLMNLRSLSVWPRPSGLACRARLCVCAEAAANEQLRPVLEGVVVRAAAMVQHQSESWNVVFVLSLFFRDMTARNAKEKNNTCNIT